MNDPMEFLIVPTDREIALLQIALATQRQIDAKQALDAAVDLYHRAWWERHDAERLLERIDGNKHHKGRDL